MSTTLGPTDSQVTKMREAVLARARPRFTRRTRRVAAMASLAVAGLASAAAAVIIAPATTDQQNVSVDCYTTADLSSAHATTMLTDDGRDRNSLRSIATRTSRALELCEADRRAVATDPGARTSPVDVPNPTVCQLGDLRLAVLPNEHAIHAAAFCKKFGLQVPTM